MGKKKSAALAQIDALIGKGGKKKKGGKKGGGSRKIGRSKRHLAAQRYLSERRWEKNKVIRIERHLKKYPQDGQAKAALVRVRESVGGFAVRARVG
jgi:hypothetical protein